MYKDVVFGQLKSNNYDFKKWDLNSEILYLWQKFKTVLN